MRFKNLALEFKAAIMNITNIKMERAEAIAAKTMKAIVSAIESGKLHGVHALNSAVDTIGHASFPKANSRMLEKIKSP